MQNGGKRIYLLKKRMQSDFGWIMSLPNAENRMKICQGKAEILLCIWREYKHRGAYRLTTLLSGSANVPFALSYRIISLSRIDISLACEVMFVCLIPAFFAGNCCSCLHEIDYYGLKS